MHPRSLGNSSSALVGNKKRPSAAEMVLQFFNKLVQGIVQHRAACKVEEAAGSAVRVPAGSTPPYLCLDGSKTAHSKSPGASSLSGAVGKRNAWFNLVTVDVLSVRQTLVRAFQWQKRRRETNFFVELDVWASVRGKDVMLERWRISHRCSRASASRDNEDGYLRMFRRMVQLVRSCFALCLSLPSHALLASHTKVATLHHCLRVLTGDRDFDTAVLVPWSSPGPVPSGAGTPDTADADDDAAASRPAPSTPRDIGTGFRPREDSSLTASPRVQAHSHFQPHGGTSPAGRGLVLLPGQEVVDGPESGSRTFDQVPLQVQLPLVPTTAGQVEIVVLYRPTCRDLLPAVFVPGDAYGAGSAAASLDSSDPSPETPQGSVTVLVSSGLAGGLIQDYADTKSATAAPPEGEASGASAVDSILLSRCESAVSRPSPFVSLAKDVDDVEDGEDDDDDPRLAVDKFLRAVKATAAAQPLEPEATLVLEQVERQLESMGEFEKRCRDVLGAGDVT